MTGNTVTDATDGAIVVFGSPGSTVSGNSIVASSQTLMGGVNLVDVNPWSGDSSVLVTSNQIVARSAMIKIGVAVGAMAWGSYNDTSYRTRNMVVRGNSFSVRRRASSDLSRLLSAIDLGRSSSCTDWVRRLIRLRDRGRWSRQRDARTEHCRQRHPLQRRHQLSLHRRLPATS